jgi:lipoyl(octanoyl) transferase
MQPPEWQISKEIVDYPAALAAMESHVERLIAGEAPEKIWLLEHPPLYTGGTSADAAELLNARFPVFETGRGGRYTYHGPGQRIAYVMLDLRSRGRDVRAYVRKLEEWVIAALAELGVTAERREGRIGLWVARADGREEKIAAIGIRIRRWVAYHGVSINVNPDLAHFSGIVPCGIAEHGVTSLAALGKTADMAALDAALQKSWARVFEN